MPWDDKSGGGGPWGQGPSGGGTGGGRGNGSGGPGGGQGPDLEEILRRGQERFRQSFPGGGGQGGGLGFRGILVGIAVLIAIWLVSGFYRVQPDEQGVVLRFGAYQDTTKNVRQIGEELGVVYLLEGRVQRAGDRLRIIVQLQTSNTAPTAQSTPPTIWKSAARCAPNRPWAF